VCRRSQGKRRKLPPATAGGGGAGNGYPGTGRVSRENEREGDPRNERNRTTTAGRWGAPPRKNRATTHAPVPGSPSPAVRGPVRSGLVLVPPAIGSARSRSALLVGEPAIYSCQYLPCCTPFSFFFFFVPFVVVGTSPDAICCCWSPDARVCARWTNARFFSKAQRCRRDSQVATRSWPAPR
jgi:hypothetical protein